MNAMPIYEFKEIFQNQAELHRAAAARAEARAVNYLYPQVVAGAARRHDSAAILIEAAVTIIANENKAASKNLPEAALKDALAADNEALIAMGRINPPYDTVFENLADNDALSAMRRINPDTYLPAPTGQAAGRRKKTKNHRKKTHKNKSRKSHRRKSKKQRKTKRRRKTKKQRKTKRRRRKSKKLYVAGDADRSDAKKGDDKKKMGDVQGEPARLQAEAARLQAEVPAAREVLRVGEEAAARSLRLDRELAEAEAEFAAFAREDPEVMDPFQIGVATDPELIAELNRRTNEN